MRYFIDTNIFLYQSLREFDELDRDVTEILDDWRNIILMSSESLREVSMLLKSGRIAKKEWISYDDVMASVIEHRIEIRYVDESHIKTLYKLRPAPNHSDPADLMIIAQAITEKIPLISSDTKFPLYTPQGLSFIFNNRRIKRR